MAAITASMVAELRAKTDAPMMECKKALTEADGDMAKAEELLRVKLGTKAGKAASRVTAEGVVATFIDGNVGALIEVNSETDFVSKNDSFMAMAKAAAQLVAKHNPARRGSPGRCGLRARRLRPHPGRRAQGPDRQDRRKHVLPPLQASLKATWLRTCTARALAWSSSSKATQLAAKDVAMHVAAMKPVALTQRRRAC